MRLALVALTVVFATAGCSLDPVTPERLRADPDRQVKFQVSEDYRQVYALILKRTRECYLHQARGKQLTVTDARDFTHNTAHVTVSLIYGPREAETYLHTEIRSAPDGTVVTTYYPRRGLAHEAAAVREWVENGKADCV